MDFDGQSFEPIAYLRSSGNLMGEVFADEMEVGEDVCDSIPMRSATQASYHTVFFFKRGIVSVGTP